MSNIVITEACNLSCPYCFADEFVNKVINEITLENFNKALTFILSSPDNRGFVGIIGGEPTLHSEYDKILGILENRQEVKEVTVFTNGIRIDETFDLMSDKFGFLININSPETIGEENYQRTINNIALLLTKFKRRSITLGINLYQTNQDYSYYLDILERFDLPSARISITVPLVNVVGPEAIKRLASFKKLAYQLYLDLLTRKIRVIFDCNKIPMCLWSDLEKKKITLFQANEDRKQLGINLEASTCNPVIDILPDLTAIRCFGLSEVSKVHISQFNSLANLKNYYIDNFDKPLSKTPTSKVCDSCQYHLAGTCYSGCLANKLFN